MGDLTAKRRHNTGKILTRIVHSPPSPPDNVQGIPSLNVSASGGGSRGGGGGGGMRRSGASHASVITSLYRLSNDNETKGFGAEGVRDALNLALGALISTVERHGGDVLRIAGDALIVLFHQVGAGLPVRLERRLRGVIWLLRGYVLFFLGCVQPVIAVVPILFLKLSRLTRRPTRPRFHRLSYASLYSPKPLCILHAPAGRSWHLACRAGGALLSVHTVRVGLHHLCWGHRCRWRGRGCGRRAFRSRGRRLRAGQLLSRRL